MAVGRRRRRYREAADEPGRLTCFRCGHVEAAHGQPLRDDLIDAGLDRAKKIVVNIGQIEIHARGSVAADLRSGDERPGELPEDERVHDVRGGVQLRKDAAALRIDEHLRLACRYGCLGVQEVPIRAIFQSNIDDAAFTPGMSQRRMIGFLPATAGMQR